MQAPLRHALELLDYEVRRDFNQILAEVDQSGKDGVLFLKAATTVLLTVAAGLLQTAAERTGEPLDLASFKSAAEDAANWARGKSKRFQTDEEWSPSQPE